ncbi:hypothetical protein [Uliginosibacterium gangwonense]|uniref:hypothetical protein n=1 Tax=Uliginosibacterium gangwonense TaxID=392736 RepID=UPI000380F164|nr:hypothetical protein [Uliginosibacterium gangwonense]
MGLTSDYVEKMQALLKKWDADFDVLAAQGKKAGSDVRAAYHERITELRAGRAAAHETFHDLRIAAESANSKMHAGMDLAWESMRTALEKAFSDLRK